MIVYQAKFLFDSFDFTTYNLNIEHYWSFLFEKEDYNQTGNC